LDEGETDLMAAIRETREEAGLVEDRDYKIVKKDTVSIMSKYLINGTKPKQVVYWLAKVNDPNVSVVMSNEHQDFKWLALSEACKITVYEEMTRVLTEAERLINENN
jgi:8-oxo-dGTP pyrophosphatase MutT (NUDIX family)